MPTWTPTSGQHQGTVPIAPPAFPLSCTPCLPRAWGLFGLGCSSPDCVIYTTSKLCSHFQLLHIQGVINYSTD